MCTNSNIFYVHTNRLIYPKYKVKLLLYHDSFYFFTAISNASLCTFKRCNVDQNIYSYILQNVDYSNK